TARVHPLNIAKDALFSRLMPLEGMKVLDYGCGTGENAVLLAACGAQVTAFDLSPFSITQAKRRAEAHGLGGRIHFDTLAAGQTGYPRHSYDVVIGFAILHHLHQDLASIYGEIDRILKLDGTAYFVEPVANSALLRALRRLV